MRLNTVHVRDCASALWTLAACAEPGTIYNIADSGDTTQGVISKAIGEYFGIKTGFVGTLLSAAAAKLGMDTIVRDTNDRHMTPWGELKKIHRLGSTPLTPFIDKELLKNANLRIDGSAIEALGFAYAHPSFNRDLMVEMIEDYTSRGMFPDLCATDGK